MKVFERLADAFVKEGVTGVFGMMGDGNMNWMAALDARSVPLYEVRHEGTGVGMADGWARATNDVAVATATSGPGVAQLATGLLTASRAASPIVVLVGESPSGDTEHPQYLDQSLFAAACESGFVRVATPDQADEAVRKAFYQARTEQRPVLLSLPMDVDAKPFDDDDDAYVPSSVLLPEEAVQPNARQVEQAAELVAASRRPVIIAGRGASRAGAQSEVAALAERIGALVATSLLAKTFLLERDPFHVGISGLFGQRQALHLFQEADCVIGIGASLNGFTTAHGYLFPEASFVHIDRRAHVLMRRATSAERYVQADARLGTQALDDALARRAFTNAGFRTPDVRERLRDLYQDREPFEIEPDAMDPRELCAVLDETVPSDVPLSMGSSNVAAFSAMTFKRSRPYILAGGFFGCVGQMLPAALGATAATKRPNLLVDGDASVMMHLADFETAVRYAWPLLVVVQNNESLGSEYNKLGIKGLKRELSVIPCPDLGAVARSFGARGHLVRNAAELRAAAEEWVRDPAPAIIDARISRNVTPITFRRTFLGQDA